MNAIVNGGGDGTGTVSSLAQTNSLGRRKDLKASMRLRIRRN